MKSHSCSEVRGVVVIVFTHSDCDYGPSKVMPSMIPMGQSDRRPLLVHGFTLSALNTRVELLDREIYLVLLAMEIYCCWTTVVVFEVR
jgi:hypothetical protein